jgi:uncharacterized protein YecA (UPF0149 family)
MIAGELVSKKGPLAEWSAAVMGEAEQQFLREKATRFRRLAREIVDARAQRALLELAEEYESCAAATEAGAPHRSGGTGKSECM